MHFSRSSYIYQCNCTKVGLYTQSHTTWAEQPGNSDWISVRGKRFLYTYKRPNRPCGPPSFLSKRVKLPDRGADHYPPSIAEVEDGVILPFPHTPSWSAQGQLYVCISELVPCIQQSTIFFCKISYYCRIFLVVGGN